jgi:hypothetical protein
MPPGFICPVASTVGNVHAPALHTPPSHAFVHEPQWLALDCRSTHTPLQLVCPGGHAHMPD